MVATIADASEHAGCIDGRQSSIFEELQAFVPSPFADLVPDSLWLLRRIDGSMIGLVRLRSNGAIESQPELPGARWGIVDGVLRVEVPSEKLATNFRLAGRSGAKQVLLGSSHGITDSVDAAHVLTSVDCMYSQLRMIHPELTNPLAGLYRPAELVDPGLPAVPVVLLAAHRTGSHLLLNLLNSSDRALIDGEIFNAGMISVFGADLPQDRKDGLDMLRLSDPVRFAKVMMTRSHHVDGRSLDAMKVRGFKLFPEHSRTMYDWALDTPEVRVIHLHRENLLAQLSSYLVARRDLAWVGGPQAGQRAKIAFDRERFERFVEMKTRYHADLRERLAARAGPWAEIDYGDISKPNVNALLSFLHGEKVDVEVRSLGLQRQLAGRTIDRFEDPGEVARALDAIGHPEWAESDSPEIGGD
jgi:LPS sulfotransferase NodH